MDAEGLHRLISGRRHCRRPSATRCEARVAFATQPAAKLSANLENWRIATKRYAKKSGGQQFFYVLVERLVSACLLGDLRAGWPQPLLITGHVP